MKNYIGFLLILLMAVGCAKAAIRLSPGKCLAQGKYLKQGELPAPADLALDGYCADLVMKRSAPHGVVSIMGSARLKEGSPAYEEVRQFAYLWTKSAWGRRYPILTGGGPGLMEAGNRGAAEAGGLSLGFNHYFQKGGQDRHNSYVNDGYMFASFSQREAELIDRAAAVVVAVGGVGTAWELFETLTKKQTRKINEIPVILLGGKKTWTHFLGYLGRLAGFKTISPEDLQSFRIAESASQAVELLQKSLSFVTP